MEFDARFVFQALDGVGVRKGEGAEKVNAFAFEGDVSLGDGSVALDVCVDVLYFYAFVFCFLNLSLHVTDGQFAAHLPTDGCGALFGVVKSEAALAGRGAKVFEVGEGNEVDGVGL